MKSLIAALLCVFVMPVQACTLRLSPEEWPPYIYRSSGHLAGLDYELISAILRQAGCKLKEEEEVPPARRQVLFQQGRIDLLLAASDTPERRGFARFTLPYRSETVGLFVLPQKLARFREAASFPALTRLGASLLTPRIGFYGDDYESALPALDANGKRSTFTTFEQGIKMLQAGRGDLIMGDTVALRHTARLLGVQIEALPFAPYHAPVHMMLNAVSTTREQLARINQAITQLERNGTLGTIRARYGVN
ncbi:substrate-binding periplasmic protein [Pseudoduganella sp. RAF53_2]|uniref:substrate-binding periplasmic protein n=1 Tax=unclassified Pseudoduganella TaxID=2637179 RepID=UPI003F9E9377